MKAAFAIVLIALVGSGMSWTIPEGFEDLAAQQRSACADKTDNALIDKLRAADTFPTESEQEQYKCYLACAFENGGFFKNNKLDREGLRKITPDYLLEEFDRVVDICKDIQMDEPCNTAMALQKCYYDNVVRKYYFTI